MVAPARQAAFDILRSVNAGARDLPAALSASRDGLREPRDQALVTELATGTLRWRGAIDHLIAHYARRPVARLDPSVLDTLRLGTYQLVYLDRIPARAAIYDAVEIARAGGARSAAGLVNAVLRAIDRERQRLPWPPDPGAAGPPARQLDYLSVTRSHPRWLVERWRDREGYDAAKAWTTFNNQPAPLTLRVNTLVTTAAALAADFAAEGIAVETARYAPDGLVVREGNPLTSPLAGSGRFLAQDETSQLVAVLANARPGERVLDTCAAPGGKTSAMAAAMRDDGLIAAVDHRAPRVDLLRRHIASSRAQAVRIVRADARRPLPFGVGFDLVLLDAPCSGLGTIRREPEIRWRREPADLAVFADTQRGLLEHAAAVVARGGRLLYATCSGEPEEDDEVVDRFLADHREFRAADPDVVARALPAQAVAVLDPDGRLRTRPWRHGLEAFFAAMLVKRKHL